MVVVGGADGKLFDDLVIAEDENYRKYLNQYDVIYLDMTGIIGATDIHESVPYIIRNVTEELLAVYPGLTVREACNMPKVQRDYFVFLRSLFKNSGGTYRWNRGR